MKTGLCETRWTVPREAIEALFCRLFKIAARKWPCTFACTARWPDAASGLETTDDAILTPDNQRYYGFQERTKRTTLLVARQGNRIFFDKLNLLNAKT
jgi:hypothetical protein